VGGALFGCTVGRGVARGIDGIVITGFSYFHANGGFWQIDDGGGTIPTGLAGLMCTLEGELCQ